MSTLDAYMDDLIKGVKDPEMKKDLIDRLDPTPKIPKYTLIGEPTLERKMYRCPHCGMCCFSNNDHADFYRHVEGCGLE